MNLVQFGLYCMCEHPFGREVDPQAGAGLGVEGIKGGGIDLVPILPKSSAVFST